MGWLISFALLEDRIIIILCKLIKLGIVRTNSDSFNGLSIIIGFWRLELQINLSLVKDIMIQFKEHETADA